MTHWDILNKENSNLVAFFTCPSASFALQCGDFLYHVIAQLQKAHCVLGLYKSVEELYHWWKYGYMNL